MCPVKKGVNTISLQLFYFWSFSCLDSLDERELFQRPYFPLNHSVSRWIPSAVMLNPDLEKSKCFGQMPRSSSRYGYVASTPDFITSPTIPKIHMPHTALKRQAVRGWADAHYTREITVNTARDSIKYNHWNDIWTMFHRCQEILHNFLIRNMNTNLESILLSFYYYILKNFI